MKTNGHKPDAPTTQSPKRAYRALIESMNEGALTMTADKIINYANQCFAKTIKCPLENVMGGSLRRFLAAKSGSKIQVLLHAGDGSLLPVQISIRPLARKVSIKATFGLVVTDMRAARRNGEMLRTLTRRLGRAQETERARVALELHDRITQLLCAVRVRSQTLADELSARDGPAKREAATLHELLGQTAEEVERIPRNLRPGVLEQLGLPAVLRATSTEFAARTGVSVKLTDAELTVRLPADIELAPARLLQEALQNVAQPARARHVTVSLVRHGALVQLAIKDDGAGFAPAQHTARRKGRGGPCGRRPDDQIGASRRHGNRGAHSPAPGGHGNQPD